MTFTGTRSYIVGAGEVAVIDPGPDDPRHLAALAAALGGERVAAVLVTHAHRDHSAGARAFAARVGAPVLAHGDPAGARSPAMAALAAAGALGGGEGIDAGFRPDRRIGEGASVAGPGWTLTALATPGHTGNSLSFAWAEGGALFPGDLVMGWATTLISPPDGDLAAFRASVARLQGLDAATYYPGHGAPVRDPQRIMAHILAHRAGREAEILARLARGPAQRRRAGGGDLCRRRSGAARRGGAQRARAPDRPRGARAGRGGRAAGGGALPAGVSYGCHSQRVHGQRIGSRQPAPAGAVGQDYRVGRLRDWRDGRGHERWRRRRWVGLASATTSARVPGLPGRQPVGDEPRQLRGGDAGAAQRHPRARA